MAQICQGRTVLIIAHRLSAVRHANRIIVMDKGRIIEAGPHDTLLNQQGGMYAYLWRMQDGGQPTDDAVTPAPSSPASQRGPQG
jgi:ATP-binding cassette, subfamily B, bacterial HlyB/CyaB